jgi:hypothetical protein
MSAKILNSRVDPLKHKVPQILLPMCIYIYIYIANPNSNLVQANKSITMSPPDPLPNYVYKILTSAPGEDLQDLELSEIDFQDGFIHLSTAEQVCRT